MENTNILITSELVKGVIKETHIFNDIILTSKLYIIKVSSSQMVDLVFSLCYFLFLFLFYFILYFLFLEQLGLGKIGHAVTSVTI